MSTVSPTIKTDLSAYVACSPDILGGKPCIAGTRVRVQDVYAMHERQGLSVGEIVGAWPHLTHAQVHAALAYAWEHRDWILELLERERDAYARLEQEGPSLTEKIRARLPNGDSKP